MSIVAKDSRWTPDEFLMLSALYGLPPAQALVRFREWFEGGMADLARYLYAVSSD